LRTW
jgi:hypothetical protein